MTIKLLAPDVAAKIAAGEVVERPASVVKELVENALDAGSRHITIETLEGGKRLIRVSDDGYGISGGEVELALTRHATSKLFSIDDLDAIHTLGFRGEALASVAAVSRLTILTRTAEEEVGTRMYLEGGDILQHELAGSPRGTVITVENLFYNVPARLKFLSSDTSERKHINALVQRYAMAYPEVRFTLIQRNTQVMQTTGSGELIDVINEVYGLEVAEQMLHVYQEPEEHRPDLHPVTVYGYVSAPALNRGNRTQITVFVNGRWIQDSSLTFAITQAYHTMLMQGRYPVAVLMVNVPPDQVDVNVHPTKAQVRFRQQNAVFGAVQKAVRASLVDQAPTPTIRANNDMVWGSPDWAARRDRLMQVTRENMRQMGMDFDENGAYDTSDQGDNAESPRPKKKRALPMLRVIGQVGATYIVSEGPQGLYLIDQHAAHERVLYEKFMAEREGQEIAVQELLEGLVVDLAPDQMVLVEDNLNLLNEVGFGVELFGRGSIRVSAVPALVANADPVDEVLAAIGEIECGEMPTEATAEQKLISRVCKQAAVKAGQVLSTEEMTALIRQLEECESPQTCPHGRPTMLHMSAERLAKEFGRLGAI